MISSGDIRNQVAKLSEIVPKFLLLARYVPNVAKSSIWDQCKKKYILRTDWQATDRPTTDLSILKISNGHISARGRPIPFIFGSTMGLWGSPYRMALFPVLKIQDGGLEKCKWRYLHCGSSNLLRVWF